MEERRSCKPDVAGPKPVISTTELLTEMERFCDKLAASQEDPPAEISASLARGFWDIYE